MLDRPALTIGVEDDPLIVTDPVTRLRDLLQASGTTATHPPAQQTSKNHPLVEQARKSATKKARELGWIV